MLHQIFLNNLPGLAVMYLGYECKKAYDNEIRSGTKSNDKKMKSLRRVVIFEFILGVGLLIFGNWIGFYEPYV